MNFWLISWTCEVLNALKTPVGASHDHNITAHVGLDIPTISNKVRNLLDVDIVSLKHAGDVTLAPSEALHQWSNTVVVLTVDVRRKLFRHNLFTTTDEIAQVDGEDAQCFL